jgi:regulator of protease activity HflC (stomatin/prohibitin superfamily)
MKLIRNIVILLIVVVTVLALTATTLLQYIPVGTTGVRTQRYAVFGKQGVVQKDFGPGWHRKLGPIDSWELFDSTVQTLEMTKDPTSGDRFGSDEVRVISGDGYTVSVDVTIKFRIMEGQAHQLYVVTGSGTKYKTLVRTASEKACIDSFGSMITEDFYNPEKRREKAEEIVAELQASLDDKYVEIIDVLIRDVQFDADYEDKIRSRKLADQEVELNKSQSEAARQRRETELIEMTTKRLVDRITKEKEAELIGMEAETDRKIVELKAEARKTVAEIRAEAEKYATENQADADLLASQLEAKGEILVRKAEAEGERLRNEAMTGQGGATLVALEAARNLSLGDLTISTMSVDLLDVPGMADRLGLDTAE